VRSPAQRGFSLNKTHQLILDRPLLTTAIPVVYITKQQNLHWQIEENLLVR
jgi:hypothetical protein